ncbi:unnamed protein product [Tuber aestivum]|uniref:Uncharacterized protein n=1 Tax=Tuber aestivum TaxID=59557 RepID=A0A292PKP2_9PEZI|nr:unnamed protein product [Tuber aestivum]
MRMIVGRHEHSSRPLPDHPNFSFSLGRCGPRKDHLRPVPFRRGDLRRRGYARHHDVAGYLEASCRRGLSCRECECLCMLTRTVSHNTLSQFLVRKSGEGVGCSTNLECADLLEILAFEE